jgi:hypothetical protein
MKIKLLMITLCFALTGALYISEAQAQNGGNPQTIASAFSLAFFVSASPAPCPPDFYGVPKEQFQTCFDYWAKQGRYPVTLSAYQVGNSIYFTGSFQQVASRPVRTLMTQQQLQQYFNEYQAQGFRPEQKSVLTTSEGPLFTVIWAKDNSPFESRNDMTQEQYAAKWKEMRAAGWINIDITPYSDSLATRYSGVWVKRPFTDYATYTDMTDADYKARFDAFFKQGFRVIRFVEYKKLKLTKSPVGNSVIPGFETRYAAIWEKIPGAYYHYYKMTQADYQAKYNQLSPQGFRLYNVSAINDHISAIWIK